MGTDLKRRAIIFAIVVVVALLFLAPTISRETFSSGWISRPIALGLDLSGGAHLVYEVQSKEAVKSSLQSSISGIRADLRSAKIAVTKATVNQDDELEIVLLSGRLKDQAKEKIEGKLRDLAFVRESEEQGRVTLVYTYKQGVAARIERDAVEQTIETLRNRVDQFGVTEPLIQRVGEKRIMLQMPGVSDIESVKKVVGSVAKLEFRLIPRGTVVETITLKDKAGAPVVVEEEVLMSGDAVSHAQVARPEGQVEVMLTLNSQGAQTFLEITSQNVGRNLAIILDGVVYSSPVIRERIPGGNASISGGFSFEEARQLAVVLRAGALQAPMTVLEERTVGPTLGQESIRKGILAIVVGSVFVFLFMLFYYKRAGCVAVGALLLNLVLILACLSAFGATLTLPGLAGLALTVGMAVDSNVIIFERIKDELRNGSTRDAAVIGGFDKALSAILDSNLSSLFAGLILYYFGTGAIRGFAVTLSVGVLTTLFCATFASRLAFDYFKLEGKTGALSI